MAMRSAWAAFAAVLAALVALGGGARLEPGAQGEYGVWGDDSTFPSRFDEAMAFLRGSMPVADRSNDKVLAGLEQHVRLSLDARHATRWASEVPWDKFLEFVLPYASLDECRDMMRAEFRARMAPLVARSRGPWSAARLINEELWGAFSDSGDDIVFVPDQTPAIMCPSQVLAARYASCTGLSIFLVEALRSVGIPARVVGTQAWDNGQIPGQPGNPANHDWVEVWAEGEWLFTGAHEAAAANRGWFYPQPVVCQTPGSPEHGIWASLWGRRGAKEPYFPMEWAPDDKSIAAEDRTAAYLADVAYDYPGETCERHEGARRV